MSLFQTGDWQLHSGRFADWIIDCNFLTDEDLDTLAQLYATWGSYQAVAAIPSGGNRFALALSRYRTPRALAQSRPIVLIADDVCTTGGSFRATRLKIHEEYPNVMVRGVAIFARGVPPNWVTAIFKLPNTWIANGPMLTLTTTPPPPTIKSPKGIQLGGFIMFDETAREPEDDPAPEDEEGGEDEGGDDEGGDEEGGDSDE